MFLSINPLELIFLNTSFIIIYNLNINLSYIKKLLNKLHIQCFNCSDGVVRSIILDFRSEDTGSNPVRSIYLLLYCFPILCWDSNLFHRVVPKTFLFLSMNPVRSIYLLLYCDVPLFGAFINRTKFAFIGVII